MAEKCPICGAPMQSHICEYCGYTRKIEEKPPKDSEEISSNPVRNETRHKKAQQSMIQNAVQPQIIIREVPVYERISVPQISRKSRWIALFLCIFFGYLGAHRFYTGKVGTGLIYLCTMGVFGIGWFLDIVVIAVGAFRDEFDLPLKR